MIKDSLDTIRKRLGQTLVGYLTTDVRRYETFSAYDTEQLVSILEPGDVILVEGDQRLSSAIKYLTQSTWSHAALYVGTDRVPAKYLSRDTPALVEADLANGVTAVPLAKYATFNTRICRAHHLTEQDCQSVVDYMVASLGMRYDLKNVIDLARYLLPNPPVPKRFRRRLLALGSGDPTRAICSSLIAQAFQMVRYPILPRIYQQDKRDEKISEILQIRHHSLFAPRDFDLSPYFEVIKPTLATGFDYNALTWKKTDSESTTVSDSTG